MRLSQGSLELVTLVVDDYDRAIKFFVEALGFELTKDEPSLTNDGRAKRWVVVTPRGAKTGLLLARADGDAQTRVVGSQVGGRVGFFLRVDDFDATYERLRAAGVAFAMAPREEPYGTVVVFQDIAGNKWDLLGPPRANRAAEGQAITIFGRSSSHFTRIARIFASELEVPYELEVVRDLTSLDAGAYGGNPALRVPSLRTEQGTWFGALTVTRELARRTSLEKQIVWPEDLVSPAAANAQELVLNAMSTGVGLIMSKLGRADANALETATEHKLKASLDGTLQWLESHADEVLASLPARDVSFLEVSLFCLVEHLAFRQVTDTTAFTTLRTFCQRLGERTSALSTPYRFDI